MSVGSAGRPDAGLPVGDPLDDSPEAMAADAVREAKLAEPRGGARRHPADCARRLVWRGTAWAAKGSDEASKKALDDLARESGLSQLTTGGEPASFAQAMSVLLALTAAGDMDPFESDSVDSALGK